MAETGSVLGKNLRELRLARGKKQDDVAKGLDIPAPTYSSWERGRTEPSIDGLLSLARYFDVSVDRLLRSESRLLRIGTWIPPVGEFHPIKNLNGLHTLMHGLVFNRLFCYDKYERRFNLELTNSWRADKSKPSYTFYLRSDITFHHGDPLVPEDVKRSYDLYLTLHPFFRQFVESVEVKKQEHAIELKLFKWLELEYLPAPYILPRNHVDDTECFEGTGPFKLTEEAQRKRLREGMEQPVRLESSNLYVDKLPSLEAVEFHKFGDVKELANSLIRGEIDLAHDLELEDSDRFNSEQWNVYTPFFLVLNQDKDLCKNENFRKAVNFAIDRERIVRAIGTKYARLLPNLHLFLILRENLPSKEENDYDLEAAKTFWNKALTSLKESGIEDTTLRVGSTFRDPVTLEVISELLDQFKEAGIDVKREDDPTKAHASVEVVAIGNAEALYQHFHSSQQSKRRWRYSNAYMDHLLDNIEGIDTYIQIQKILTAELLFLPLLRRAVVTTFTKNLDTKAGLRKANVLYHGPNLVDWELR